jgi:hypothetical protein
MARVLSLARAKMGHAMLTVLSNGRMAEIWCDGYVLAVRLSKTTRGEPGDWVGFPVPHGRVDAELDDLTEHPSNSGTTDLAASIIKDSEDATTPTVIVRNIVSRHEKCRNVEELNSALRRFGIEMLRAPVPQKESEAASSSERAYGSLQVRILAAQPITVWTEGPGRSAQYLAASRKPLYSGSSGSGWLLADCSASQPQFRFSDGSGEDRFVDPKFAVKILAQPMVATPLTQASA